MTVSSTTAKVSYSGNGSTTAFTVNFYFLATSDLKVTLRKADGTEVVKTLSTDYTVTGAGVSSGGTVTMGTAPASGETLVIQRNVPLTQLVDYQPNDPFPANTHEQALDKLTMEVQQLNEAVARAIKVSTTNTINSPEFTVDAATRANKVLSFDGTGELAVTQELGQSKGNWASGTAYVVRDLIKDTSNGNVYICLTAHTSSGAQPISTNTDSAKWRLIVDAAAATSSASAAASSASAAATSATAAAASATAAATSATNSASSATASASSASTATTQASNASTSASNAATSATAAASSATAAANSATAAAAAAASGLYRQVLDKTANYTVVAADQGTLFRMNTGSGALTVTLPLISTVTDGFKVSIVKWTGDGNGVTINRSGSDTINGATSSTIGSQYSQITFVADFETNTWFAASSGLGATNVVTDVFSGNNSTTAFTLSGDPGSKNNTYVFISGVYQQKSTYSQSGTTITFSTAPPNGTSNVEIVWTQPLAIGVPSDGTINSAKLASGSQLTIPNAVNENANVTLASAATVNIGAATANTINISGTTTITAFDTIAAGAVRRLVFAGVLTLTYNATSLILPGAANITTAAGDVAELVSLGSGNWKCFNYVRAANAPYTPVNKAGDTMTGALTLGGLLDTGSTGQIKFPAAQNASSNANTLDDYEEGSWTLTVTPGSGSFTVANNTGYYVKIGKVVYVNMWWRRTGEAGLGGTLALGGFPFPFESNSTDISRQRLWVSGYSFNGLTSKSVMVVVPDGGGSATTGVISAQATDYVGGVTLTASNFSGNNTEIYINGFYMTNT